MPDIDRLRALRGKQADQPSWLNRALDQEKPEQLVEKIARSFAREPRVRIPTYIKKAQAKRCGITVQELESYLQKIDYHIDRPAARGLKRFLDAQRRLL